MQLSKPLFQDDNSNRNNRKKDLMNAIQKALAISKNQEQEGKLWKKHQKNQKEEDSFHRHMGTKWL